MTKTDVVDIAAAYNRLRLFIKDMEGLKNIKEEAALNLQYDLKAALMQDGSKNGLINVVKFVQKMYQSKVLKENHFINLLKDLETMNRAEF